MTMGRKLFMANVGDSRGIVIKSMPEPEAEGVDGAPKNPNVNCTCQALTRDHKPDDEDEAKRIIENNGRIDSYRDH